MIPFVRTFRLRAKNCAAHLRASTKQQNGRGPGAVLDSPSPSLATEPAQPSARTKRRSARRPWPKTFVAGITILGLLVICALLPDRFLPYDPIAFDYG